MRKINYHAYWDRWSIFHDQLFAQEGESNEWYNRLHMLPFHPLLPLYIGSHIRQSISIERWVEVFENMCINRIPHSYVKTKSSRFFFCYRKLIASLRVRIVQFYDKWAKRTSRSPPPRHILMGSQRSKNRGVVDLCNGDTSVASRPDQVAFGRWELTAGNQDYWANYDGLRLELKCCAVCLW